MVESILKSCAGLDVHKKEIKDCIAHGDLDASYPLVLAPE
jgi:hypothetical protein